MIDQNGSYSRAATTAITDAQFTLEVCFLESDMARPLSRCTKRQRMAPAHTTPTSRAFGTVTDRRRHADGDAGWLQATENASTCTH